MTFRGPVKITYYWNNHLIFPVFSISTTKPNQSCRIPVVEYLLHYHMEIIFFNTRVGVWDLPVLQVLCQFVACFAFPSPNFTQAFEEDSLHVLYDPNTQGPEEGTKWPWGSHRSGYPRTFINWPLNLSSAKFTTITSNEFLIISYLIFTKLWERQFIRLHCMYCLQHN